MTFYLKYFIVGCMLLNMTNVFSQCAISMCDPEIDVVNYNVACVSQNNNSILTVKWKMNGACQAPAGSWAIQISLPVSGVYGSVGVSDVTRPSIFNWSYSSDTKAFTGRSNQSISQSSLDSIKINVSGLILNSCAMIGTQVNVFIVSNAFGGCSQAFQNDTGNDSDAALLGVQQQLPVALKDFSVKSLSCNKVELYWDTASERNNKYFEVERSVNGRDFLTVGKVEGSNEPGGSSYSFLDDKNMVGISNFYYRLKQVDFDGKFEHFDIIKVENTCENEGVSMSVYPNPAFDKVNVSLYGLSENDRVKLVITNAIGEVVMTIPNASASAINEIKLNGLTAGIYNVKLVGFEETTSKRFIKVD